jgi:hypothetical protein
MALASLQGQKKSRFSGPTPSNAPRNDVAPLKTIMYRAIKTTGTLIVSIVMERVWYWLSFLGAAQLWPSGIPAAGVQYFYSDVDTFTCCCRNIKPKNQFAKSFSKIYIWDLGESLG